MPFFTYSLLTVTMFIWGGTFIAGRLLAEAISPAPAAFVRFSIASIALLILMFLAREKFARPQGKELVGILCLGATGVFLYNVFFFTGLQLIDAGRAALIIATAPLTITFLAVIFLGEPLTIKKVSGISISLTGAILVITNGHPSTILQRGFGTGELYMIGCVLSWAAYTLVGKKMLISMTPLASVCYSSIAGTIMLLYPALTSGLVIQIATLTTHSWLSLIYLGVLGTALGFSWYYHGIKKIGATKAGVFINLVPVFAIFLSWLILDEAVKISVLTGGLLVLAGVTVTNYSAKKSLK